MEFQPPPIGSAPLTNGSARPVTDEWPAVPPAPTPVKPAAAVATPEPPLIRSGVRMVRPLSPAADDDSPTVAIPAPATLVSVPAPTSAVPLLEPTRESPMLGHPGRERQPGDHDLIWQSTFAYVTGGIILGALLLLTLPLWIVVFRLTDPASNNGAGPDVGNLIALCMMLMGAFLTAAATSMIIVEMRARVRIVDALAHLGDRDAAAYQLPSFDPTPFDPAQLGPSPGEMNQPVTAPIPATAMPGAFSATTPGPMGQPSGRAGGHQGTTGELLGAFGGMLRAFGQLPAQVAMLAIALVLFVGATVLSVS